MYSTLYKELLTNDTEKSESTKPHTAQTVAQQCTLLDSRDYFKMETDADQPVTYSLKHADPSESEDRNTRTTLVDAKHAQAKTNKAIVT